MPDPMMQSREPVPILFSQDGARAQAAAVTARTIGQRHQNILAILRQHGPLAIFEVAAIMDVGDNQISGRFSELEREGLIARTGRQKVKPATGCNAEIYAAVDRKF